MSDTDKPLWSRWEITLLVFIVIVALVLAGGYASYALLFKDQNPAGSNIIVENGDTVTVEYIGMFEDGTVFDTSIRTVSENNSMYPKSQSFSPKTEYAPLSFTVGAGQMIKGFDKGVVGMAVNQTKILTIVPEDGYGYPDESLIKTKSLFDSIPVFQWFGNSSDFINTFSVSPTIGTNVKNAQYGWNMTVFHIDALSDTILLRNNPFIGEIVQSAYGWQSKVISIDSSANSGNGEIIIKHLISSADIGTTLFKDEAGNEFRVSGISPDTGTFTIDLNREVVGKTLIFKITVVSVTKIT